MKKKVLITGASGNVGRAVLSATATNAEVQLLAGVRDASTTIPGATPVFFDFLDLAQSTEALADLDVLFLLRPPQLTDIEGIFKPLIELCVRHQTKHILFLSVQGAERSKRIPHHKIERLISESGIPYTFIRPAYFMQNLTTMLKEDIVARDRIFLPAGKALFNWIDVGDIGKVVAKVIAGPEDFVKAELTLTSTRRIGFAETAALLSRATGRSIQYISPNLLRFILVKRKEGLDFSFIMVMIMLHFLPRFQKTPPLTQDFENIMELPPNTLEEFIMANKEQWERRSRSGGSAA